MKQEQMPKIPKLWQGVIIFFTGIFIAFLGGNGLMLLIGIGVMFYGGFIMMPDAWDLYQKYQRFKAQDKKDVAAINPKKLPYIDVPAREEKPTKAFIRQPKQPVEGYYEDGMWKTRRVK